MFNNFNIKVFKFLIFRSLSKTVRTDYYFIILFNNTYYILLILYLHENLLYFLFKENK